LVENQVIFKVVNW